MGSDAEPMVNAIKVQLELNFLTLGARAVDAEDFHEAAIAAIGAFARDHAVNWGVGGAVTLETDTNHICCRELLFGKVVSLKRGEGIQIFSIVKGFSWWKRILPLWRSQGIE